MRERWAVKVQNECEAAGFTFTKRDDNGHWECKDGSATSCKVLFQSRSLGDVLRKVGNALSIQNALEIPN